MREEIGAGNVSHVESQIDRNLNGGNERQAKGRAGRITWSPVKPSIIF